MLFCLWGYWYCHVHKKEHTYNIIWCLYIYIYYTLLYIQYIYNIHVMFLDFYCVRCMSLSLSIFNLHLELLIDQCWITVAGLQGVLCRYFSKHVHGKAFFRGTMGVLEIGIFCCWCWWSNHLQVAKYINNTMIFYLIYWYYILMIWYIYIYLSTWFSL